MLFFSVLPNLFILKLLLASITQLSAYDFGYYPSAEEFDNFVRETEHTWTRDLLANEHRRAWTEKPPYRDPAGYFVPKYNENQALRAHSASQTTSTWPGYVKRLGRPQQDTRKPSSSLSGSNIASSLDFNMFGDVGQNEMADGVGVGELNASVLPEITLNDMQQTHAAHSSVINPSTFSSFSRPQPQPSADSKKVYAVKQTLDSVNEFAASSESPTTTVKLSQNRNDTQFPIFFSNPATGIVYAITEVGNFPSSVTPTSLTSNGSIPIFVSKAQYEHDLYALREYFEKKCHIEVGRDPVRRKNSTSHSYTDTHPQIIRLQRPTSPTFTKTPGNKLPTQSHKPPPPVLVQSELTIRDQSHFPTRKHKPKIKRKIKKKKPNRPGRKPVRANATQSDWPQIVRGVRVSTAKPQTSTETLQTLATQVEKPNAENTDFKLSVKEVASVEDASLDDVGKRAKRSVTNIRAQMERVTNRTRTAAYAPEQLSLSRMSGWQPVTNTRRSFVVATRDQLIGKRRLKLWNSTEIVRPTISGEIGSYVRQTLEERPQTEVSSKTPKSTMTARRPRIRNRRPKLGNFTEIKNPTIIGEIGSHLSQTMAFRLQTEVSSETPALKITTKRPRIRNRRPKLSNHKKIHTSSSTVRNHTNWPNSRQQANLTNRQRSRLLELNGSTELPVSSPTSNIDRGRRVKHKRRKHKAKDEKRGEFDIFDFGSDEDYDDEDEGGDELKRHKHKNKDGEADDEDDEDDYGLDDEDDSNESFEDVEAAEDDVRPTNKLLNQKRRKPAAEDSDSSVATEDYTAESNEQTSEYNKNSIVIDSGSSAEPSADYGAMDTTENVLPEPPTATTTTTITTTTTTTKTTTNKPTTTSTKKPPSTTHKTRTQTKKRIRRRPATKSDTSSLSYEDYDDDADDGGGVGGFFRMIFYPVQVFMNGIADTMGSKESVEEEQYSYPTYTTYHNGIQAAERDGEYDDADEEADEQSSSLTSWLSSLFGFNRRTKNIGSTTPYPPPPPPITRPMPTQTPSWFETLFGFGGAKSTTASSIIEDSNEQNDKWFFGWFDTRPQRRRRRKTTTTTTTAHTPHQQVPILTIVDPLKNPQNWIGILAHHIINATATSVTQNPIINAIAAAQSTHNPELPRKVTYDRYQIWRLKPLDDMQVHVLEEYKKSDEGAKLQWLKGPSLRGLTDVLVPPKQLLDFEASLNFESIAHEVLIYDVGKAIAYEQAQEAFHFNAAMHPHKHQKYSHKHHQQQQQQQQQPLIMSWHKYYEFDDIITHLEMLRMRHPQLVELIHIGRSYEGRPLVIVKIESKEHALAAGQTQLTQKKLKNKRKTKEANSVFIESGTHGLEWIGPATSLWMISELLRLIKSNKTTIDNDYIKNTTWYFMPILNPDGYVYSHKYDRFWRKTRSRHIARRTGIIDSAMTWLQQKKAATRVCHGVDLDRNWHYQWGKRGSSKWPCNELYAGPGPFSEPESKALSEFLIDYRKQMKLYISLQSYGQIISYPMKANVSFNAERIDDFLDVAMVGTDGLRKQGSKSRYKIDSTNDLVEKRSGCSDAFAAYEVGIPFSFTLQLADNGVHGYLLPSASIESTARDTFEIITAMVDYI